MYSNHLTINNMIGKLKLSVLTTPLELDLKKVTILLGDNNFYSYTVFDYIKALIGANLNTYNISGIICDTDLLKIKNSRILEDNRKINSSIYLHASLYDSSAIFHRIHNSNKDIFLLDYVDFTLSPKDSIGLISYLIKLYKEGKRLIIRTCNIFTIYYLNVLFIKGEINEEDLAIYNIDSKLNTSNLIRESHLDGIKEIDSSYFNNYMYYINEELFKAIRTTNINKHYENQSF